MQRSPRRRLLPILAVVTTAGAAWGAGTTFGRNDVHTVFYISKSNDVALAEAIRERETRAAACAERTVSRGHAAVIELPAEIDALHGESRRR